MRNWPLLGKNRPRILFLLILKKKTWTSYVTPGPRLPMDKDLMQGKLFQRCTHLLYCSVLSPGGNVNTRRMSKPNMGSIFYINNQWNILVIGNYYLNYQNYQNSMLLTSSDTKRALMHLFLFTNSAQRDWFKYVRSFPWITFFPNCNNTTKQ